MTVMNAILASVTAGGGFIVLVYLLVRGLTAADDALVRRRDKRRAQRASSARQELDDVDKRFTRLEAKHAELRDQIRDADRRILDVDKRISGVEHEQRQTQARLIRALEVAPRSDVGTGRAHSGVELGLEAKGSHDVPVRAVTVDVHFSPGPEVDVRRVTQAALERALGNGRGRHERGYLGRRSDENRADTIVTSRVDPSHVTSADGSGDDVLPEQDGEGRRVDREVVDRDAAVDRVLAIHRHDERPSMGSGPEALTSEVPTATLRGTADTRSSTDAGESAGDAATPAPALAEGGEQS